MADSQASLLEQVRSGANRQLQLLAAEGLLPLAARGPDPAPGRPRPRATIPRSRRSARREPCARWTSALAGALPGAPGGRGGARLLRRREQPSGAASRPSCGGATCRGSSSSTSRAGSRPISRRSCCCARTPSSRSRRSWTRWRTTPSSPPTRSGASPSTASTCCPGSAPSRRPAAPAGRGDGRRGPELAIDGRRGELRRPRGRGRARRPASPRGRSACCRSPPGSSSTRGAAARPALDPAARHQPPGRRLGDRQQQPLRPGGRADRLQPRPWSRRCWTRSPGSASGSSRYTVAKALVQNPRTPAAHRHASWSPGWPSRDLRDLGRDRNIPDAVRSTALRLYRIKQQ